MKMRITFLTISSLFVVSCVSQPEYDKVVNQKNKLETERNALRNELDEIKFGVPNLLSDGIKFYQARDFSHARPKLQEIIDKHSDRLEAIDARKYLSNIDEEELWDQASKSEDISFCANYIHYYPQGKYITNAIARKEDLQVLKLQKAFQEATVLNSSVGWKNFLDNYPDFEKAEQIRKTIIRLEVEEILGNNRTGQMPSFSQYSNNSYTSISSVQITNNTGCELIVRYSGPDVEMIIIPVGATKTVNLLSGDYKIAASACGSNYAGSEGLHGTYGSTFYISTSKSYY